MMNYYDLLQIDQDASIEIIDAAYKKLAKKYHPDSYRGNADEAAEIMKELNNAKAILKDPVQRYDYNQKLAKEKNYTTNKGKAAEEELRWKTEEERRRKEEERRRREESKRKPKDLVPQSEINKQSKNQEEMFWKTEAERLYKEAEDLKRQVDEERFRNEQERQKNETEDAVRKAEAEKILREAEEIKRQANEEILHTNEIKEEQHRNKVKIFVTSMVFLAVIFFIFLQIFNRNNNNTNNESGNDQVYNDVTEEDNNENEYDPVYNDTTEDDSEPQPTSTDEIDDSLEFTEEPDESNNDVQGESNLTNDVVNNQDENINAEDNIDQTPVSDDSQNVKIMNAHLEIDESEIKVGDSTVAKLLYDIIPEGETVPKIDFLSSSSKIATIDDNGVIKGVSPGKVTIYATIDNQKYMQDIVVKKEDKYVLETIITGPEGSSDGKLGLAKVNKILDFVITKDGDIYFLDTYDWYNTYSAKSIRKYDSKTNEIETISIDDRFDFTATDSAGEDIIYSHDKFNPLSLSYDSKNDRVYVYNAYAAYMIYPSVEFISFTPGGGYYDGLSGMGFDYDNDLIYLLDGGYRSSAVFRAENQSEAILLAYGDDMPGLYWDIHGLVQDNFLYICQKTNDSFANAYIKVIKFNTFTGYYETVYSQEGESIGVYDDNHFIALADDAFVKIDFEGNSEMLFAVSSVALNGEMELGAGGNIHCIKTDADNNILFSEGNAIRKITIKGNR